MERDGAEDRPVPGDSDPTVSESIAKANALAATALVEALARLGLKHAVLTPGSRSTPLAVALAKNSAIKTHIHFDERGAAFMAYGIGKATRTPAAAVCTSGTAVANYLPAAVEASNAAVPLLLITADRPPELQDCGANQTIHQPGIFGVYARWERTLPCPDEGESITDILDAATDAMRHALTPPAGPVHLNCMYREPLATVDEAKIALPSAMDDWSPAHAIEAPPLAEDVFAALKDDVASAKRGIIIAGTLDSQEDSDAVRALVRAWRWPLFADITSGLRANEGVGDDEELYISHYDLMLASSEARKKLDADTLIHFGGPFVSKRLQQYIEGLSPERYIHVAADPRRRDPGGKVTQSVTAGVASLAKKLAAECPVAKNDTWLAQVNAVHDPVFDVIADETEKSVVDNEIMIARALVPPTVPEHRPILFLGNSMPVRDADMFMSPWELVAGVFANRGASGIDGNIATIAGIAKGTGRPVVAVLGDLTFFHDMNSLPLLRDLNNVSIVVPNNDGGGIFRFLPIGERSDVFDPYFTTPHGMTLESVATQFGFGYCTTNDTTELFQRLLETPSGSGNCIIEVPIDRDANHAAHRRIVDAVRKALGDSI